MSNPLIGKTIANLEIAADQQALRFVLSDGAEIVVECDGDCCSHTWVEHVEMPALGFPAKVISVEDLDSRDEQDGELKFYGCKITTDRGEIVIDYRNSSNGYYGGNLVWPGPDAYHYGGVFDQNKSKHEWRSIQ